MLQNQAKLKYKNPLPFSAGNLLQNQFHRRFGKAKANCITKVHWIPILSVESPKAKYCL